MIMESYYNSDEEVCWGPVTAREIKKSLQRPRKAVDRRRTVRMNSPPRKPKHYHHDEDMQSLAENVSTLSIESKYYTPNETMQKSLQTNFEEKASQILNNIEPEAAIDTTIDETAVTVSPESNALLNKLKSSVDFILLGKTVREKELPTSANITCIGDNVQDSCLLNNFQITLANSYSSDDGENLSNNIEDIIETLNNDLASSNNKKNENKHNVSVNVNSHLVKIENEAEMYDNVITISDDEDDLSSCGINDSLRYQGTQSQYEDISEVFEDNISTELDNDISIKEIDNDHITSEIIKNKIDLSSFEINESLGCQETQSQYEEISEVFEDDISTDVDSDSEERNKDRIKSEIIKNKIDISCRINESSKCQDLQNEEMSEFNISTELECDTKVNDHITLEMIKNKSEVPMNRQSANESMDLHFELNDTLDEINRALEMGLDYSISESVSTQGEESEKELKSAKPECPKNDQETHSFNYMASPELLKKTYTKNVLTEIKPLNDFRNKDNLRNPINHSIKLHTQQLNKDRNKEFKQPLRPIKSPIPKYQNSLNFKNIKSPVAVYIKNSPSPCLQQNIPISRISRLPIKTSITPQKVCKSKISLPSVAYKPAHNALLAKKKEIKLPASIEKFIPMKPTITKHEERVVNSNRGCKDYVSRKLEMDYDLTQSSIDDASLLGMSTQDVSILTSKKAFIS